MSGAPKLYPTLTHPKGWQNTCSSRRRCNNHQVCLFSAHLGVTQPMATPNPRPLSE
jgi:hypothetical protein